MKKALCLLTIICCLILSCFAGCTKQNVLLNSVSELRYMLFDGQSENYTIKACYGFNEVPINNDATVGNKVYRLTFRLLDKELEDITYSLTFELNGETYKTDFKLNPITDTVTAQVEIENFNEKQFNVTVCAGSQNETVVLKTIVPEKTISYQTALDCLAKEQKNLISAYTDENGNFNAELFVRLVVKNGAPYWYVGIASGGNKLKALLIDGLSGKTLAIREIF